MGCKKYSFSGINSISVKDYFKAINSPIVLFKAYKLRVTE